MIGIDVVSVERIDLTNTRFIEMVLTDEERQEFSLYSTDSRKKEYIAGRFAAKEAIFKASQDRDYLKYTILHEPSGRPYVKDHPEISVSISHDGGIAAAIIQIQAK
ncbi:MAG: holo-ACP synthase [Erysipelotrichaceae bacterium]|nr:holo-ACP synthase [Erysipelotrichaceae bacterium]